MANSFRASALLAALLLSGCETLSYYLQAANGHAELMRLARPVQEVIDDPATSPALRSQLAAAAAIREFASRELKLPDNGSYRRYAALGRPFAVWNVVAAPEFSLEPVVSCFPFAGCVTYRGFFSREDAERYAAEQRAEGRDAYVAGVPAYSTLGWTDDPLLSTFIGYPAPELARLLFHELAHQELYLKGDSAFNESFAVAVEREGLRRWLAAAHDDAEAVKRDEERMRLLEALLRDARERLAAIYARPLDPEKMREEKRRSFAALREQGRAIRGYERLFEAEPNNAFLAAFATYTQYVPAFERLLRESGGNLESFYAKAKELSGLEKTLRDEKLKD